MNVISKSGNLFALALDHGEATYLERDELLARRDRVRHAYDPAGLENLKAMTSDYIAGRRDLTAMEFYLELEQASLLILFHTLPRRGARNMHANGLQQSYGDHIRLMMLGFDKFDQFDIDWLVSRRWQTPIDVGRSELEESMRRYHDLDLAPSEKVAMWITSALHDYGKIFRRGYGLDAEDAAPLCKDLVEGIAPEGMSELIHYGIRNHDLIEHTVTGDTPAGFITAPLAELPEQVRPRALPMLALIQHIGAASLGEGRLSKAKLDIYTACLDGTIVASGDSETRLGRLIFGGRAVPDPDATARAAEWSAGMAGQDRRVLLDLLDRTVLHGWSAVRSRILDEEGDDGDPIARLVRTLVLVGRLWSGTSPVPTHVVMARPQELVKCTAAGGCGDLRPNGEDKTTELLNGAVALILR